VSGAGWTTETRHRRAGGRLLLPIDRSIDRSVKCSCRVADCRGRHQAGRRSSSRHCLHAVRRVTHVSVTCMHIIWAMGTYSVLHVAMHAVQCHVIHTSSSSMHAPSLKRAARPCLGLVLFPFKFQVFSLSPSHQF
jgi:hypothetical protein